MIKENAPKKHTEDKQAVIKAVKPNPVARFLAMCNTVAVAELPTFGGAAIVMSIIAILFSIKFISMEFMR